MRERERERERWKGSNSSIIFIISSLAFMTDVDIFADSAIVSSQTECSTST